jgi:exopolyphosphatase/guanosine-5'-triphosphate,3'-diphosphate pyrophosphatase
VQANHPVAGGEGNALLAVVDLGTNNCRLLIARPSGGDGFQVVDSFSRIVRLGEGLAATGRLSDAAIDRTVKALSVCAQLIARHKVRHVRAYATQAARLAANTDVLIGRAKEEAGITLTVITAQEEADLAALGCAPLIGSQYKGALIFDIGGGSTEVVHLRRTAPESGAFDTLLSASLPVGVVTLAESADGTAPFASMRETMRRRFAPLAGGGFDPAAEHLLGTSGTVTTLAAIAMNLPRYDRAKVDMSWHRTADLLQVAEHIAGLDVTGLARIGPIGRERADLMHAGVAIFSAICDLWPGERLRVADRGLREGMLRQLEQDLSR